MADHALGAADVHFAENAEVASSVAFKAILQLSYLRELSASLGGACLGVGVIAREFYG